MSEPLPPDPRRPQPPGPQPPCAPQAGQPQPGHYPPAKKGGGGATVAIIAIVGTLALVGLCVIVPILLLLLLPAINAAREAARRNGCANNVRQICLAMMQHESEYGYFPPAHGAVNDNGPPVSWRVRLLPYLEEQALFKTYDFDKPWDDPANRALLKQTPRAYLCPSSSIDEGRTNYVVVVGQETIFPGGPGREGPKPRDIPDGASKTILVVEVAGPGVPWTKPVDVRLADLDFDRIGKPGQLGSEHAGGVFEAGFADGHVIAIHPSVDPETLCAALTARGGGNEPPVILD